jgi:hypothetical protein
MPLMRSTKGLAGGSASRSRPERAMNIDVTKEELAFLRSMLEEKWGDLRVEIRRTDAENYREQLRALERTTVGLLRRLETAQAGPPGRAE